MTLAQVDVAALEAVRKARQDEIMARVAKEGPFEPLPPLTDAKVTTALPGTVVTGPDGFFAFPVADTGMYWLRVEKDGYTYGQREAEIVKERSTATNAIYLTPIDPAVTPCGPAGCSHTSSDGMLQVVVPPGAIPAGQTLDVTATNFEQVEYLPSGELPPGTWETYAFNLGGDSEVTFVQPVTVRMRNTAVLLPGSPFRLATGTR